MYNKYSISREKKSIMLKTFENKLKTFENKFDYLINYKRNEFDLVRQISKKKFNLSIQLIEKAIKLKKNIFVCGNGGSASTANHLSCDVFKRISQNTRLKPKVISLVNNMELITAISNDIKYEKIFSFQYESLRNSGDLIIIFSVSGNSKNLIELARSAAKKNKIISFTGKNGGRVKKLSTINININSTNYGIVEDIHLSLMHSISQIIRIRNLQKFTKKIEL